MSRAEPETCDKCKREAPLTPTGHTTQWGVHCTVYLCDDCW